MYCYLKNKKFDVEMLLIAKAENRLILGFPYCRPSSINHFLLNLEQNKFLNWCKKKNDVENSEVLIAIAENARPNLGFPYGPSSINQSLPFKNRTKQIVELMYIISLAYQKGKD